jgi:peptide/bleomycin uptake transporter
MFPSFFPLPRLFFVSATLWTALTVALWYAAGRHLGEQLGFTRHGPPIIGLDVLWSKPSLWFDLYFAGAVAIFAGAWRIAAPTRWWRWSVLGSALLTFASYVQVQFQVTLNAWNGPFYDLLQAALSHSGRVTPEQYYHLLAVFMALAVGFVVQSALVQFFISHYIFRWRTAMNEYYVSNWSRLRRIEGASQRIQEDTMRFATITQGLGQTLVGSVMTLIAFTPVLLQLSQHIQRLPIIGRIPGGLLVGAAGWAIVGTGLVALVGVRLPGLEFRNQRVEAAYRKELVYGEDQPHRAQPAELAQLFKSVRRNYFALYFNFAYFNVARVLYLLTNSIIAYVVLGPTILAGAISLGLVQQTISAFSQVLASFQYLVTSWEAIVELQSIYKRLRSFEATLDGEALPLIEAAAGP